jgi:hypothetical protein
MLLQVEEGIVSVAAVDEGINILYERYIHRGEQEEVYVPTPVGTRYLLVRNIDDNKSRSVLIVRQMELVAHAKELPVSV